MVNTDQPGVNSEQPEATDYKLDDITVIEQPAVDSKALGSDIPEEIIECLLTICLCCLFDACEDLREELDCC